jgi:hypothetical protein
MSRARLNAELGERGKTGPLPRRERLETLQKWCASMNFVGEMKPF